MATYGVTFYGTDTYGAPPYVVIQATEFKATPHEFDSLFLTWGNPHSSGSTEWTHLRLVRSSYGSPVSLTDGVTLFEDTLAAARTTYLDKGLAASRFYYYTLFVRTASDGRWKVSGTTQGLVTQRFEYGERLYELLPEVHRTRDYALGTPLKRFLDMLGYQYDRIRTELETLRDVANIDVVSGGLLPVMAQSLGVEYEPELGQRISRSIIKNAVHASKTKGTITGVESVASAYTGFGSSVRIGANLMLDRNDSEFLESVGHWEIVDRSATVTHRAANLITAPIAGLGVMAISSATSEQPAVVRSGDFNDLTLVPVTGGQDYTASIYVRSVTQSGQVTVRLNFYNLQGQVLPQSTETRVGSTTTWARVIPPPILSPATAAWAAITVSIVSPATGDVHHVTGAQIERGRSASSFESARTVLVYLRAARTNLALNPSVEVDLEGWSATNATLTRPTGGSGIFGSYTLRATADANGSIVVTYEGSADVFEENIYTSSLHVRGNNRSVVLSMQWLDVTDSIISTATGEAVSEVGGVTFVRPRVTGLAPVGTERVRIRLTISGASAGEAHTIDGLLIEPDEFLRPYFDADSTPEADYLWGTSPHASASFFYPNRTIKSARLRMVLPDHLPLGAKGILRFAEVLEEETDVGGGGGGGGGGGETNLGFDQRYYDSNDYVTYGSTTEPETQFLASDFPGFASGGTQSVRIGNGRTLWLFGKTTLEDGRVLNNMAYLQVGKIFSRLLSGGRDDADARREWIPNALDETWYWPNDGEVVGTNRLHVYASRMNSTGPGVFDFETVGVARATFSLPDVTLLDVVDLPQAMPANGVIYGAATVGEYVYGTKINGNPGHDLYVAQVQGDDWKYWNGTTWVSDASAAAVIIPNLDAGPSVDVQGGQYRIVAKDGGLIGATISAYTGPHPYGPWTKQLLHNIPSFGPGVFVYGAKGHPEQVMQEGGMLVSWNTIAEAGIANAYVPKFVVSNDSVSPPSFVNRLPISVAGTPSTPITLSVLSQGVGPLGYGWRYKDTAGEWTTLPTAINPTLNVGLLPLSAHGRIYEAYVANAGGSAVTATTISLVADPRITQQPQNRTIEAGQAPFFSVVAAGTGPFTYVWQQKSSGIFTNIPDKTTATLTDAVVSVEASGRQYRVIVTGPKGSVTSDVATLTVIPPTNTQVPVITGNPTNAAANPANNFTATFTVTAVGPTLLYQWESREAGSVAWVTVPDAVGFSYTVTGVGLEANGRQYRCKVSNAGGVVYSLPATLTVTNPTILPDVGAQYYNPTSVVTAVNAAATLADIQTAVAPIATAYGITITIKTSAAETISIYTANPLVSGNLAATKSTVAGCVRALTQYPLSYIAATGFDRLIFCGLLAVTSNPASTAGGIQPDIGADRSIWIDSRTAPTDWSTGKVFHHEFAHVIQNTPDEASRAATFTAYNDPAFPYGGAWTVGYSGRPPGYTLGGWSSYIEDQAEIHAFYMTAETNTDFSTWVSTDTRLRNKQTLWRQVVGYWAQPVQTPPGQVTGATGTPAGSGTASVSWSAPSTVGSGITGYRVETLSVNV